MNENTEGTKTIVGNKVPIRFSDWLSEEITEVDFLHKVPVLVVFFATWCGACLKEMGHLKEYIWKKYASRGLQILAIGREQQAKFLLEFKNKENIDFSVIPDPERKIYNLFASKFIPRNVLIGRDGTIKYQSVGYEEKELESAIEKEL